MNDHNSNITNEDRAYCAAVLIDAYIGETDCGPHESLCDLLSDLMHWADTKCIDFDEMLNTAREHYTVEHAAEALAKGGG